MRRHRRTTTMGGWSGSVAAASTCRRDRSSWTAKRNTSNHRRSTCSPICSFIAIESSPSHELLDEVWGDQFVSESALTTRIKEIRRAVGDDGTRQEVIKNFRGRGYRLVAEVDDETRPMPGRRKRPAATSLFGRDDDIAAVDRLLDNEPLVTLVGPGGVGKTSLARDVAALRRNLHTDGALIVRLASVRDPDVIPHVLRRNTGLEDAGRRRGGSHRGDRRPRRTVGAGQLRARHR